MTFRKYLRQRQKEDTPVGDLARSVYFDKHTPKSDDYNVWYQHIKLCGGESNGALRSLDEAWVSYQDAPDAPAGEPRFSPWKADLHRIEAIPLPNYIGVPRSLYRVRAKPFLSPIEALEKSHDDLQHYNKFVTIASCGP